MNTTDDHDRFRPAPTGIQMARSLLAEIAELGCHHLDPARHLAVLRTLDALEDAALVPWPPPDPADELTDLDAALASAQAALRTAAYELNLEGVDVLGVGIAARHLTDALGPRPRGDRTPGGPLFERQPLGGRS